MASEQAMPDAVAVQEGILAYPTLRPLPVLARLPDLDAPVPESKPTMQTTAVRASPPHQHKHQLPPQLTMLAKTTGRIIAAKLSTKLLIGLVMFLTTAACLPTLNFWSGRKSAATPSETSQATSSTPAAEAAPAVKPECSASSPPAALTLPPAPVLPPPLLNKDAVSADSSAKPPLPAVCENKSAENQNAPSEPADYSPWPNPAHPILAGTVPASDGDGNAQAVANRPAAVGEPSSDRPRFEQADSRGNVVPGKVVNPYTAPGTNSPESAKPSGGAQLEGTIVTPSDRNVYDRSRPGIP